jgi:hypothetical protein
MGDGAQRRGKELAAEYAEYYKRPAKIIVVVRI